MYSDPCADGNQCRRGTCVPTSLGEDPRPVCMCDEGWTGFSDWVNADGVTCFINHNAIVALWSLNFAVAGGLFLLNAPRIYDLIVKFLETRARMMLKGKRYGLWHNQGLLAVLILYAFCTGFNVITGIIRLSMSDTQRVGATWLISITWLVSRNGFYLSQALHQPALLSYMLRAQNATDSVVRKSTRVTYAITAWTIINGLWVVPVLLTKDVSVARGCYGAFVFGQVIGFSALSIQASFLQKNLDKILTESINQNHSQAVMLLRDKLNLIHKSAVNQSRIQAVLFTITGVIPFLYTTHDYILPLSWLGPTVVGFKLTKSIHTSKNKGNNGATSMGTNPQNSKGSRSQKSPIPSMNDTAIESKDLTSVVNVDESSPELLAAGTEWTIQSAARKALRWRKSSKKPPRAARIAEEDNDTMISTYAEMDVN